jgi:AraC-like DNA-binding protein
MLWPADPAPALKPFVRKYLQLKVSTPGSALVFPPVPARSIPAIEFTFADPYLIRHLDRPRLELAYPVTLIGAKTGRRIQLESQGRVESFLIFFQPTGLQHLFSLPGGEIVNEHYEADSVLNSRLALLRTELGEAKSFGQRVKIADRFFSRLIPPLDERRGLESVVRMMITKQGCVRVPALADATGIGLRQFERLFTSHLGIGPKAYTRILRFEAAIYKKAASRLNWTTIAHELGYCDQMHMIRDFQSLSGENPKQLTPHCEFLSSISTGFPRLNDDPCASLNELSTHVEETPATR